MTVPLEERLALSLSRSRLEDFEVAVVLGSGLGAFADALADPTCVPFEEVDGMPPSGVPGHAGRFVVGTLGGRRVLVQQGRVHFYEGRNADEVTATMRAYAHLGANVVLLTNAAGCLEPAWELPALMRITDHLNLQGRAPLRRSERGRGKPYDPKTAEALDRAADEVGVKLHCGVYAGMLGPAYETPAEIR
ncbi:MAG: purine-nucleoside phosphorylase, partial [Planctomycetota bacterium]|nr:purine-nucleoside phosphorylase [Planctomycetota bacterium]